MAAKSKLELLMELSDKLFNSKLSQVQQKMSGGMGKMRDQLDRFNMKQVKVFSNIGKTFDPVHINQLEELTDKVSGKLDFTSDINKTKVALRQMDVKEVDAIARKVHELGKVWGDTDDEIIRAANSMTKQLGGTFDTNLALLQAGYEKGANLNGDMIDQFKEYSPQMKELGLNAAQMMAVMAHAGKEGVFSDKAIDAIKEANLSLKEMGPAQIDALTGIGLSVDKLKGKTSFEATQMIAKAMQGATAQAKQLALTDIFKGAGEDAGMSFITGLGSINLDPRNLESFQQANAGLTSWISNVESYVADKMGGFAPYLQGIAMAAVTISSLISVIQALTAAQWFSNIAAAASPYMWVAVAIAAVIAVAVVAINKFDEWGAALLLALGPLGLIISAFKSLYDHWDSIKKAFSEGGILAGLRRIGIVLLDALLKPVQQLLELLSNIPGLGDLAGKGASFIKDLRQSLELETPGEKEARAKTASQEPQKTTPQAANEALYKKSPVIDGKLVPTGKSKKTGENINRVAGQANQVRNISIQIDAFNKGGINVAPSDIKGMSLADVEAWFMESMRRVMLNVERG